MGYEAPTPIVVPIHHAPKKAPCPKCGKQGRRKRTITRRVRTVAYKAVIYLKITCGEYVARCDCSTTFCKTHKDVFPRAAQGNKVRDLVLDRNFKYGMSVERTLQTPRREYLLELSSGFVYDMFYDRVAQLNLGTPRRKVLKYLRRLAKINCPFAILGGWCNSTRRGASLA